MKELICDVCGQESNHFFLNQVKDDTWKWGIRDVWVCHRHINLRLELLDFIGSQCLNSMEICRLLNGFESDDFKGCYAGREFAFITRTERCNYKEQGCTFWSLTVYNALRELERKRLIHSVKTRFFDKRQGGGKRLDVFRFWFRDYEAYEKRVLRQRLEWYFQ